MAAPAFAAADEEEAGEEEEELEEEGEEEELEEEEEGEAEEAEASTEVQEDTIARIQGLKVKAGDSRKSQSGKRTGSIVNIDGDDPILDRGSS